MAADPRSDPQSLLKLVKTVTTGKEDKPKEREVEAQEETSNIIELAMSTASADLHKLSTRFAGEKVGEE